MSEAKYKVGDDVRVPAVSDPLTIVAVETCYRFSPNGALWREDELAPYVRPLAVGDRVRWSNDQTSDPVRTIVAFDGEVAWCKQDYAGRALYCSLNRCSLERIPTEAGK